MKKGITFKIIFSILFGIATCGTALCDNGEQPFRLWTKLDNVSCSWYTTQSGIREQHNLNNTTALSITSDYGYNPLAWIPTFINNVFVNSPILRFLSQLFNLFLIDTYCEARVDTEELSEGIAQGDAYKTRLARLVGNNIWCDISYQLDAELATDNDSPNVERIQNLLHEAEQLVARGNLPRRQVESYCFNVAHRYGKFLASHPNLEASYESTLQAIETHLNTLVRLNGESARSGIRAALASETLGNTIVSGLWGGEPQPIATQLRNRSRGMSTIVRAYSVGPR